MLCQITLIYNSPYVCYIYSYIYILTHIYAYSTHNTYYMNLIDDKRQGSSKSHCMIDFASLHLLITFGSSRLTSWVSIGLCGRCLWHWTMGSPADSLSNISITPTPSGTSMICNSGGESDDVDSDSDAQPRATVDSDSDSDSVSSSTRTSAESDDTSSSIEMNEEDTYTTVQPNMTSYVQRQVWIYLFNTGFSKCKF